MGAAQIANPMAEYLLKLQLIVTNSEFKNDEEANKYETLESKLAGEAYVRAVLKTDIFESYQYDGYRVYNLLVENGYSDERAQLLIKNPMMIPKNLRDILLEEQRELLISKYEEPNKYYLTLMGKPFKGNKQYPADEILRIPDEFYERYKSDTIISRSEQIDELPARYQELFMNSEFYEPMLKAHPNATYLRYIGSNSIPLTVSRKARDGDIMRINTYKLSTYHSIFGNVSVEANIIHAFSNIYKATRDYVYNTLRGDFSDIYPNYNDLIRFLTIYMSIGASMNEFQKKSSKLIYMNNVTANNLFMLYGLPSVIMEGAPMIEFLKKFRLLLMDKGTNVVYRVKDLIGYSDTDIYTLVMVKQQVFENGKPQYMYGENGERIPRSRIVFRRLGTTDDNTSYFKFRESKKEYPWEEIASGDPRWWNDSTTESILQDMNFTLSNSKYIQLSTHMSMTDVWWQCVIFLRGLLDRRQETANALIGLNRDINGSSTISVFDAVLSLIVMMHWQLTNFKGDPMAGDMYIPKNGLQTCVDMLFNGLDNDGCPLPLIEGNPFKVASFNFDVRNTDIDAFNALYTYDYLEPEHFMNDMVIKVLDLATTNTGEMLMKDIKLIYKYLEEKVRTSRTIQEFRQATDAYNLLFLVDPIRSSWYEGMETDSEKLICEKYNISSIEYEQLKTTFLNAKPEPEEDPDHPDPRNVGPGYVLVDYQGKTYKVSLYDVLSENVYYMDINDSFPFRDSTFIGLFETSILNDAKRDTYIQTSTLSQNMKNNYKRIIIDKVNIDIGSSIYGPTSFENLLMMDNPKLYEYMLQQKAEGNENIILMLRAIIKGLEQYANTSLAALESKALGVEEYFRILKEVITYFKSYMVEFTKDEFTYIFGGLLDNGGNSDMLKLLDEINHGAMEIAPDDSLALFDVSHATTQYTMGDDTRGTMYDEVLFRLKAAYKNIKDTGYDIWYDDGKRITKMAYAIDDETEVIANIVHDDNGGIKIIINVNNLDVIPPNYYGNAR